MFVKDYKRTALLEADIQCSKIIQSMEAKLRAACHAPDAKLDSVIQVSYTSPLETYSDTIIDATMHMMAKC